MLTLVNTVYVIVPEPDELLEWCQLKDARAVRILDDIVAVMLGLPKTKVGKP